MKNLKKILLVLTFSMSLQGMIAQNTNYGSRSLASNTTGYANSAFGSNSLWNNTTGFFNTGIGSDALLSNIAGAYNTALGSNSLYSNTNANYNTAIGYQALFNNVYGSSNTAVGYQAGYSYNINTGNGGITAVGYDALYSNSTGTFNVSVGHGSMVDNVSGAFNTALGSAALSLQTLDNDNTAIGFSALLGEKGGSDNTAIGYYAGGAASGTPYSQCTFLGDQSDFGATGTPVNVTSVGYFSFALTSNTAMIGNTSTTSVGSHAGVFLTSDGRFKKDIQENVPGLAFITALRPVTYHYDMPKLDKFVYGDKAEKYENSLKESIDAKGKILYTGFVAQEVEAAAKKIGYDFSGIKTPQNEKDMYAINYSEFVIPLVKGMQEQQKMIDSQACTIVQQQQMLTNLMAKIDVISTQLNDIRECCSNNGNISNGSSNNSLPSLSTPLLFNAVPNPTSGSTVISYYLPLTYKSASIKIADINGQLIHTETITNSGYSSSIIQLSNLSSAIYTYSLIVDGKVVDTKNLSIVFK